MYLIFIDKACAHASLLHMPFPSPAPPAAKKGLERTVCESKTLQIIPWIVFFQIDKCPPKNDSGYDHFNTLHFYLSYLFSKAYTQYLIYPPTLSMGLERDKKKNTFQISMLGFRKAPNPSFRSKQSKKRLFPKLFYFVTSAYVAPMYIDVHT